MILATGADDGQLVLSHALTGQKLHTFAPFKNGQTTAVPMDCVISKQSEFVAAAYTDSFVRLFDLKSRKLTKIFRN
jgi:WD40 repeat protein